MKTPIAPIAAAYFGDDLDEASGNGRDVLHAAENRVEAFGGLPQAVFDLPCRLFELSRAAVEYVDELLDVGIVLAVHDGFGDVLHGQHEIVAVLVRHLVLRTVAVHALVAFFRVQERNCGLHVVLEDPERHIAAGGLEKLLCLGDLGLERLHDVLRNHHPPVADLDAVLADVRERRLHRGDVALQRVEVRLADGGRRIVPERVDPLRERTQLRGDVLVDRRERFRRAVHRERLARHEVVHLGLEDGSDVGIGVLAVCREIDGEVLHLPGQMVDFHRTAVADHGELVHPVYQVFADALVLRVRAAHLRLVPDDRIHDLADLPEQGGEVLLRLDGRGDCLARRRLEVVLFVRADGGGKLSAAELVEGLERLRGSVGRLCEKLERVLVEKTLVHKRLERMLHLLAVKALRRGHGGLHQKDVQLRDHLSDGLLAVVHRRVCALLLNLRRLDSLRLRGIDAAKEVVHRHVVDVYARKWHGNISFLLSSCCLHAARQKVTAK